MKCALISGVSSKRSSCALSERDRASAVGTPYQRQRGVLEHRIGCAARHTVDERLCRARKLRDLVPGEIGLQIRLVNVARCSDIIGVVEFGERIILVAVVVEPRSTGQPIGKLKTR